MSEERNNNTDDWLLPHLDKAIKEADGKIHDTFLHLHWLHWHPISTAPLNRDLEVRVAESRHIVPRYAH